MSDIDLKFPVWVSIAFLGLQFWYVLAPAAMALAALGWFGRALPKPLRLIAAIGSAACVAPFLFLLNLVVADSLRAARAPAEDRARHRTLTAPETVDGLPLPAGAVLAFADETQKVLNSIALPRPMTVVGIVLTGEIQPITGREWLGALAQDQSIGDWPCRAGDVWFTPQGDATRCTLSAGHRFVGYDLPAGAEVRHEPERGGWDFQLSQQGPALHIAALAADLPAGGTLTLAADGALRRLYVRHETPMTISGVPLFDHIVAHGSTAIGELAAPTSAEGVMLPAEAIVRLDLTTGKIAQTSRSLLLDH